MKNNALKSIVVIVIAFMTSCQDLDLNPLYYGSSENWYSSEEELEMSVNGLYRSVFWRLADHTWDDDFQSRNNVSAITGGTINGETSDVGTLWTNSYKAIARANVLLENIEKIRSLGLTEKKVKQYAAEARFVRAAQYANLVFYFGDVVYVDSDITIEQAFKMGRMDKNLVMEKVYEDFDSAVVNLPLTYSANEITRATKGAAYALKARHALYNGDWALAAQAAKNCMDLGVYTLHSNFSNLFLASTRKSPESILVFPRSIEFNSLVYAPGTVQAYVPRNRGGYASRYPSMDLFYSFLCSDGKPIDESPLFDPKMPFKNRDPRCVATIVEFGSLHLGVIYDPNPKTTHVMNYLTGRSIPNKDTKSVDQYASYNGLILKKGIDEAWVNDNTFRVDPDLIYMRYADVLLTYAEAKIELNEIDQTVLDAINSVRARAYGVNLSSNSYPKVTTTNQTELRTIIRFERRMEFAFEGLRYYDIIRWRIAEKVLNKPNYGLLDRDQLIQYVDYGYWFTPVTPEIDEDAHADLTPLYNNGFINLIVQRSFNADRQYLWPIPSKELLINDNIAQNPNY